MADAEDRVNEYLAGKANWDGRASIDFGTNGAELKIGDLRIVLELLAEQRMLCDLYRKEALGRAEDKAAEYMAQHDLT